MTAALLCLVLATAPAAEGPVAVMPFKNLNADPKLDWLKLGIAETMIADLRKAGAAKVVERDQLDRALAEIALQGQKTTDESTAAAAGKMVGARTVVVGSFQQAGGQLRIAARFVTVETGLVQDTAKVTGRLDEVFALQDQIVVKLTGASPTAPPPKRKTKPKTVEAYRLYAMSLATASDVDRIGLLKQSLELDPDFTYAADELAALEKRMKGYREQNEKRTLEKSDESRSTLFSSAGTPQERTQLAMQLLGQHMTSRRYKALIEDAQKILGMDLPNMGTFSPKDLAAYSVFLGWTQLKKRDLALQAGEAYMKLFPAGTYFTAVDMQMQQLLNERKAQPEHEAALEKRLAEIEEDRRDFEKKRRRPPNDDDLRQLAFRRCAAASSERLHARTVAECRALLAKWPDAAGIELSSARLMVTMAEMELGDFAAAKAMAQELAAKDPTFARNSSVQTLELTWPRE